MALLCRHFIHLFLHADFHKIKSVIYFFENIILKLLTSLKDFSSNCVKDSKMLL